MIIEYEGKIHFYVNSQSYPGFLRHFAVALENPNPPPKSMAISTLVLMNRWDRYRWPMPKPLADTVVRSRGPKPWADSVDRFRRPIPEDIGFGYGQRLRLRTTASAADLGCGYGQRLRLRLRITDLRNLGGGFGAGLRQSGIENQDMIKN